MKNELEELQAAMQPLIDACYRYPELQCHVRRTVDAFGAVVQTALGSPPPAPRDRTAMAMAAIKKGAPVAPTAREYGLSPSTLFRAIARERERAATTA
ncbi:hypothetical protein DAPPUDRAFT_273011 [Daphnia pulex]|uniref:Uncharacterized protein n=1 Tax=Daphnia pulex TaxID=6669 RepID=E9I3C1_DAPPU|nr:hypothetical protein DAPPUDRAFT_273011 [Daphnia pulex]|eukprot:EFX61510.1 hypothetical protein DAPPUDRAFT_273011 [Daphnia pulex]